MAPNSESEQLVAARTHLARRMSRRRVLKVLIWNPLLLELSGGHYCFGAPNPDASAGTRAASITLGLCCQAAAVIKIHRYGLAAAAPLLTILQRSCEK